MKYLPILSPGKRLPLISGADSYSVGWSALTKAENIRFDKGAYRSRLPLEEVAASPGSGTCVGLSYLNSYAYIAMLDSGNVDIYRRQYTTSFGAATKITSSGKQLVDPDGFVSTAFSDYGEGDTVLFFQDGTSDALIYRYGAMERSFTVNPPTKWKVEYRPAVVKAPNASDTPTNSANITITSDTSSIGRRWHIVNTGVTSSQTASVAFNSSVDLSGTKQIWILGSDAGLWRRAATISLTYASGVVELTGPTAIIPCGGGLSVFAYDVRDENLSSVTGFQVVTSNIESGADFDIYAICAGGVVPGGSSYAATFLSTGRISESIPTVLESTEGSWNIGITVTNNIYIPVDKRLFYRPRIYRAEPTQSGVDYVVLYRSEPGEEKFYQADYEDVSGRVRDTFDDTVASGDRDKRYWAPTQYQVKIPIGRSYIAGGRHFVASGRSFWASEKDQPLHFNDVVPEDTTYADGAGQEFRLDSDESAVGIIAASASVQGSPDIYAFSDKSVYRIFEDGRILRISNVGCGAAGSICEFRGRIWFLGSDKQFYSLSGGVINQSRDIVDNVTLAMSDISRVTSSWEQDRMLSHTTGIQVWDGFYGAWEGRDVPGVTTVGVCQWVPGSTLVARSNGAIYKYGSTDNEGGFTCTLETGLLAAASVGAEEIQAHQMRLLVSSAIAITTTRTNGAGTTDTGTVSNTSATPMFRHDTNLAKSRTPGMDASAISLKIAFAGGSGTKVYAWQVETDTGGHIADV